MIEPVSECDDYTVIMYDEPASSYSTRTTREDPDGIYGYLAEVIRSFGDAATEDVFNGKNSRAARRLPKDIWKVTQRKLDMIDAAQALNDLRSPPGNRLEALKGDRVGQYSVRVNDQFRITFRFENGIAYDVVCEDYH